MESGSWATSKCFFQEHNFYHFRVLTLWQTGFLGSPRPESNHGGRLTYKGGDGVLLRRYLWRGLRSGTP
jgi:hypothetical protein